MKFFEYLDNEFTRMTFELRAEYDIVKQAESQVMQALVGYVRKWLRFLAYFKVIFKYLKCKVLNKFPEKVDLQALLQKEKPKDVVPGPEVQAPPTDVVPKT